MPSQHTTRRRTSSLDDESREMLYDGLNLSQLSIAFRMDHRVLVEKLHGCPATGNRNGTETWRLEVAAPFLVKPLGDIESHIKRMNPADLPKALAREFWTAIKTRQEVEKANGDLWPTERVVGTIGALMKLMKMSVRLMSDTVDMQSELSDAQRRIVKQLGDSMLEQLYAEVREQFKPKKVEDKELPISPEAEGMAQRLVTLLSMDMEVIDAVLELAAVDARIMKRAVKIAKREDDDEL
jgi:hypothetical protein